MYQKLPLTGVGALTVGGVAIGIPVIAIVGAAAIIGGFLILRMVKPNRIPKKEL